MTTRVAAASFFVVTLVATATACQQADAEFKVALFRQAASMKAARKLPNAVSEIAIALEQPDVLRAMLAHQARQSPQVRNNHRLRIVSLASEYVRADLAMSLFEGLPAEDRPALAAEVAFALGFEGKFDQLRKLFALTSAQVQQTHQWLAEAKTAAVNPVWLLLRCCCIDQSADR